MLAIIENGKFTAILDEIDPIKSQFPSDFCKNMKL